MFAAGAGVIGQYEQCTFRLAGTGTFFGTEATNPTVGAEGPARGRERVAAGSRLPGGDPARRAGGHAVGPLVRGAGVRRLPAEGRARSRRRGPGRRAAGRGPAARPGRDGQGASCPPGPCRWSATSARPVKRVAIACGAAGEFLADAVKARADVFLTGEMRFHDYLAAEAQGIALVLPGPLRDRAAGGRGTGRPACGGEFPDVDGVGQPTRGRPGDGRVGWVKRRGGFAERRADPPRGRDAAPVGRRPPSAALRAGLTHPTDSRAAGCRFRTRPRPAPPGGP